MKLTKCGPETDAAGEPLSSLLEESADLAQLKNCGLNIANEMGESDAMWVTGKPVVGSNRIADVRDWQLEISESCFLRITE